MLRYVLRRRSVGWFDPTLDPTQTEILEWKRVCSVVTGYGVVVSLLLSYILT